MLECAAAGFVDDRLVRERVEFGDYVVTGLTTDEETA